MRQFGNWILAVGCVLFVLWFLVQDSVMSVLDVVLGFAVIVLAFLIFVRSLRNPVYLLTPRKGSWLAGLSAFIFLCTTAYFVLGRRLLGDPTGRNTARYAPLFMFSSWIVLGAAAVYHALTPGPTFLGEPPGATVGDKRRLRLRALAVGVFWVALSSVGLLWVFYFRR
jgi:hypothetical protein